MYSGEGSGKLGQHQTKRVGLSDRASLYESNATNLIFLRCVLFQQCVRVTHTLTVIMTSREILNEPQRGESLMTGSDRARSWDVTKVGPAQDPEKCGRVKYYSIQRGHVTFFIHFRH